MDRKKVRAGALARLKSRIVELERDALLTPCAGKGLPPPLAEKNIPLWPGVAAERGALHEMRSSDWRNAPAAFGFALAVAMKIAGRKGVFVFIERASAARDGVLSGRGLAAFGLDPSRALFIRVRKDADALFAAEEAARAKDVAAALLILKGKAERLTLTATRRLHLAARRSGATPIIIRAHAPSEATAATMRWRIESRPSAPAYFDERAPGAPRWRIAIEKAASDCRLSAVQESFLVEWRHDERRFILSESEAAATDSRPLLPAAFRRPSSPANEDGRLSARAL